MATFADEFELSGQWAGFTLPPALERRLQTLLDKQDLKGKLPDEEYAEALALTELVEILSLMKLKSDRRKAENGE